MNKILNYTRGVLAIICSVLSCILYFLSSKNYMMFIFGCLLCIFWLGTTVVDLFRKNYFNNRHNIVTIFILLTLLFTYLKPWIDITFFTSFGAPFVMNNTLIIFEQNYFIISIIIVSLFVLNYVDYKLN